LDARVNAYLHKSGQPIKARALNALDSLSQLQNRENAKLSSKRSQLYQSSLQHSPRLVQIPEEPSELKTVIEERFHKNPVDGKHSVQRQRPGSA
jgi:hypothetical protein